MHIIPFRQGHCKHFESRMGSRGKSFTLAQSEILGMLYLHRQGVQVTEVKPHLEDGPEKGR